ncbi:MAG: TIGR03013 family PEP-CTERM/XrtA system glycosyltransferase [Rubrivivax sp.]|nr:TIGR03013 family PEP-CTERM/XrtA system glycosyltransferase [Rubrivivax sp.]
MIRIFNHYLHRDTLRQALADLGFLVVALLAALSTQFEYLNNWLPIASTQVLSLTAGVFVIGTASGVYQKSGNVTLVQTCARATLALMLALPLTYVIFGLLPAEPQTRLTVQISAMVGVAAVLMRRIYVTHSGAVTGERTRVLIFGTGKAAKIVGDTLEDSDPLAQIVGYVPGPNESEPAVPLKMILNGDRPLTQIAHEHGVDEIIVALTERRAGSMPLRQLLDCKLFGIKVYDLATHFEKRLGLIRVEFVNAGWLVFGDGFNQGALRSAVKRLFDVVFALLLIVLSAPVMIIAALLIKLDSRGPLVYRQERVGINGSTFMVAKFRSMRTDAEQDGKPRWASLQDDRVTRVGAIIRRLRIDELPQLFNVLRGDMSLVGPRPERPFFVDQLTQQIPYFAVRHSVKPGVTGWAQVRYQYGATVEDAQQKLQYDLYYVKNHSLFLDAIILLETVGVVLTGKGAR